MKSTHVQSFQVCKSMVSATVRNGIPCHKDTIVVKWISRGMPHHQMVISLAATGRYFQEFNFFHFLFHLPSLHIKWRSLLFTDMNIIVISVTIIIMIGNSTKPFVLSMMMTCIYLNDYARCSWFVLACIWSPFPISLSLTALVMGPTQSASEETRRTCINDFQDSAKLVNNLGHITAHFILEPFLPT